MDWTKAKTIIIAALLLTNIVILGAWMAKAHDGARGDEDATLRAILSSGGIFLETELPKKPGRMAVLYVQPETNDAAAVRRALAAQEALSSATLSDEGLAAAADAILESCGYMDESAEIALPPERDGGRAYVRYRDVFDGIPIEEGYIVCEFEGSRAVGVDRKWYTPVELHDRKGEIITPLRALIQLLGDKEGDDSLIIRGIELVYWVSPQGVSEGSPVADTALPAWKITDSEGTTRYIAAYEQS
ncbi:MAG: hypothetical protein LBS32_07295 [Clostridiales Family XIII bacterium]|jgi:hypothetical protein|nr:hypothetical protein [Clostridiales Family XIII bacterium]